MTTTDDDIDELVGKPIRRDAAALLEQHTTTRKIGKSSAIMVEDMHHGVTASWLAQVFGMDHKTVKQRIAGCPVLENRANGYVYDLKVVAAYLVKPALSFETILKNLKPSDLPPGLSEAFWGAALKRQKWEENAGQLWRTEKVLEVLGETFQMIKMTIKTWRDSLENETGLSAEQVQLLQRLSDGLQNDIHKKVLDRAAAKKTGPLKAEMNDMMNPPPKVDADVDELV